MSNEAGADSHELEEIEKAQRDTSVKPPAEDDVDTVSQPSVKDETDGSLGAVLRGYISWEKNFRKSGIATLKRACGSQSFIKRSIWAIIFTIAFFGSLYPITRAILRYSSRPTATSLVSQSEEFEGLPFPAVTICPLNVFANSTRDGQIKGRLLEYLFQPSYIFDFSGNHTNVLTSCNNLASNLTQSSMEEAIWSTYDENHSINFIVYCGFLASAGEDVIRCENEFQPVLTSFGICYQFNGIHNGNEDRIAKTTGARYGLKLILNINQDEYQAYDGNSGVKVVVHERDDIARPNLYGLGIPPGRNAFVGVRKRTEEDETRVVNCIQDQNLSFYEHLDYSQFACRQNAQVEYIASECGCITEQERPATGLYTNTPDCTFGDSCCILNATHNFDPRGVGCDLPCHFSYYETVLSYSSFPTGPYLEELAQQINKTTETARQDLLSLTVYLEDLIVTTIVTRYSYPLDALLGNIGGQFSLWVGIGVMSFIELCFIVLDVLKELLCPKRMKNEVQTFDNKLMNCCHSCFCCSRKTAKSK